MRNKPDIDEIDIDDLYNNLRVYKDEMKRSSSSTSTSQNLAFLSSKNTSSTNEVSTVSGDFGKGTYAREWQIWKGIRRRSYGEMAGSMHQPNESSSQAMVLNQMSARDKTGLGYDTQLNEISNNSKTDSEISLSVFDVRSSDEESTPDNDRFSKADGYHVVPLPITGNFLTPRADISFAGLDEYAIMKKIIESKTTNLNTKTSETVGKTNEANTQKPKTVYESVNKDKVIIEDWNSDNEDDVSENSGSFMLKKVEYVDPKGISKSVMAWI
ncbi:hypothetical protein Tco_0754787, partial [Tanacetum coccineum]